MRTNHPYGEREYPDRRGIVSFRLGSIARHIPLGSRDRVSRGCRARPMSSAVDKKAAGKARRSEFSGQHRKHFSRSLLLRLEGQQLDPLLDLLAGLDIDPFDHAVARS